jgi:hypothetical protein
MAVSDVSTPPGDNTSISGLAVSDATVVNTWDNIIRQLMADVRAADDANVKLTGDQTIAGAKTLSGTVNVTGQLQEGGVRVQPRIISSSGVGQIQTLDVGASTALALPGTGGQTYAYWYISQNTSDKSLNVSTVGVGAGGPGQQHHAGGQETAGDDAERKRPDGGSSDVR